MSKIIRSVEIGKVTRMLSAPARGRGHVHRPDATVAPDNGYSPAQAEVVEQASAVKEPTENLRTIHGSIEQARKKAQQEGFETGLQQGRRQGAAEYQEHITALRQLLRETEQKLAAHWHAQEDMMVEVVFTALCKILGEAWSQPQAQIDAVRAAAAHIQSQSRLSVRVAPRDFALLQAEKQTLITEGGGAIELVADDTVQYGGAIIESDAGQLDARLERQLQQLKTLLLQVRATHTPQEVV